MTDQLLLADEVAIELKKVKNFGSACYIVFERENIPSCQRPDLSSSIGKELGRRGGIKSGKTRRKKKKVKKEERKTEKMFSDWQIDLMIDESLDIIGERSDCLLDP
jgi:hypothetical protein